MKKRMRLSHKISRFIIFAACISIITILCSFFLVVSPAMKRDAVEAANAQIQLISQQVKGKTDLIESYAAIISDSYDLKNALFLYQNDAQKEELRNNITDELDIKKRMMDGVMLITIQTSDGPLIPTTGVMTEEIAGFFKSAEYKEFLRLNYSGKFFGIYQIPYSSDHAWGNEPQNRTVATYCMNFHVGSETYTITLLVEIDDIVELSKMLLLEGIDSYGIMDHSYSIFTGDPDGKLSSLAEKHLNERLWYNFNVYEENGGYFFIHTMENSKWTFCAFMSNASLLNMYGGTFFSSMALIIILVIIMIALLLPRINRYVAPLNHLSKTMQRAGEGELTVRCNIHTNDEFEDVGLEFNRMIERLDNYMKKLLDQEKKEERMKYGFLISQINPHFIYNTMNTINYLARKGKNKDIVEINSALIRILQDYLRINEIEIFDSIEQELNMVRQYMLIQQYRYNTDVAIEYDVPGELLGYKIPKNIIQPLVENALIHGFINAEGDVMRGTIRIEGRREESCLLIRVIDDGYGITEDIAEEINREGETQTEEERGKHIGIRNIRERMSYLYKDGNCLQIKKRRGSGTCVTIRIPDLETDFM